MKDLVSVEFNLVDPPAGKVFVIIVYDIVSNNVRNRLIKLIRSYGFRIQKSVFEAVSTLERIKSLCSKIPAIVDGETDSVVVYVFTKDFRIWSIGKSIESKANMLSDEPILI